MTKNFNKRRQNMACNVHSCFDVPKQKKRDTILILHWRKIKARTPTGTLLRTPSLILRYFGRLLRTLTQTPWLDTQLAKLKARTLFLDTPETPSDTILGYF